jgi:hypothetical protein
MEITTAQGFMDGKPTYNVILRTDVDSPQATCLVLQCASERTMVTVFKAVRDNVVNVIVASIPNTDD